MRHEGDRAAAAQGTLLNDVWLLAVGDDAGNAGSRDWRWLRGAPLGASPTARRGAACGVVAGSRLALCGGLSHSGALDSLLLLSSDFGCAELRRPSLRRHALAQSHQDPSAGQRPLRMAYWQRVAADIFVLSRAGDWGGEGAPLCSDGLRVYV